MGGGGGGDAKIKASSSSLPIPPPARGGGSGRAGRKLSEESKAKIRANHPKSLNVKVLNIETDITMEFPSIYQTAKYFETNHTTIRNYIKNKKPYRNIYMISI